LPFYLFNFTFRIVTAIEIHVLKVKMIHFHCIASSLARFIAQACLNKNEFTVELTEGNFIKNLCPGLKRKLAVEAVCG